MVTMAINLLGTTLKNPEATTKLYAAIFYQLFKNFLFQSNLNKEANIN